MTTSQLELQPAPTKPASVNIWLQHAAGRISFEDLRGYALDRIDPNLSPNEREAAEKAINDAVYGLMMVIDGVSGSLRNETAAVKLFVSARLLNQSEQVSVEIDLNQGDGMCMGYHDWMNGDFGEYALAVTKPRKT